MSLIDISKLGDDGCAVKVVPEELLTGEMVAKVSNFVEQFVPITEVSIDYDESEIWLKFKYSIEEELGAELEDRFWENFGASR